MNIKAITEAIVDDEGLRLTLYYDHLGNPTIGYGTNLRCISKRQAVALRDIAIDDIIQVIFKKYPFLEEISESRQVVIVNMGYNLGIFGLSMFKKMFAALEKKCYDKAAEEIIDSEAYRDPKLQARYQRFADIMRGDHGGEKNDTR